MSFLKAPELKEMINKLELWQKTAKNEVTRLGYALCINVLKLILEGDCGEVYDGKL